MVSVDFAAQFSASLGELGRHLDRHSDAMSSVERALRRPPAQPFYIPKFAANVSGASGDVVVDLGGPNSGRIWYVMRWTFGGRLWSDARAGVGLLVVSGTPPTAAATVGLSHIVAVSTNTNQALPFTAPYSRGQIPVRFPERVYAICTAPTATAEYTSSIIAEQIEEAERVQVEAT